MCPIDLRLRLWLASLQRDVTMALSRLIESYLARSRRHIGVQTVVSGADEGGDEIADVNSSQNNWGFSLNKP